MASKNARKKLMEELQGVISSAVSQFYSQSDMRCYGCGTERELVPTEIKFDSQKKSWYIMGEPEKPIGWSRVVLTIESPKDRYGYYGFKEAMVHFCPECTKEREYDKLAISGSSG